MKPGRPLTFGSYHSSWFFGLPGNPVAVMVTFLQFVQPAINYLASGSIKPEIFNCFIHLPIESTGVSSGEKVEILPFKNTL